MRWSRDVERVEIGDGDAGAQETVEAMLDKIHEWGSHPSVRRQAIEIVSEARVAENDRRGEISAIFDWVRSNIRYVDEHVETIQAPLATIEIGGGDCDDYVVLLGSLLAALGHWPQRIKLVAADNSRPDEFSHVYMEVFDGRGWLALDGIVKDKPLGWYPKQVNRVNTYGVGYPREYPRTLPIHARGIHANGMIGRKQVNYEPHRSNGVSPANDRLFTQISGSEYGGLGVLLRGPRVGTLGQELQQSAGTTAWAGEKYVLPILGTALDIFRVKTVGTEQTELYRAQTELERAKLAAQGYKAPGAPIDMNKVLMYGGIAVAALVLIPRLLK